MLTYEQGHTASKHDQDLAVPVPAPGGRQAELGAREVVPVLRGQEGGGQGRSGHTRALVAWTVGAGPEPRSRQHAQHVHTHTQTPRTHRQTRTHTGTHTWAAACCGNAYEHVLTPNWGWGSRHPVVI